MALTSIWQHKQKKIRRLQQQICELQTLQEMLQDSKQAANSISA